MIRISLQQPECFAGGSERFTVNAQQRKDPDNNVKWCTINARESGCSSETEALNHR